MKSASNDTQQKDEKNKKKRFDRKEQMSLSNVKIAGSLINQGFLFSSDKFYAVNEKAKIIDTNTATRIKEIARANGVTENVFFQNIWEVALMNFLKTKDVVVGSVVSGRDTSVRGIENIAGLLMTVLPVRLTEKEIQFREQLKNSQSDNSRLQRYINVDSRDLFEKEYEDYQSAFIFENYPISDNKAFFENNDSEYSILSVEEREELQFDLNLYVIPRNDIFELQLSYNLNMYDDKQVDELFTIVDCLIKKVIEDSNITIIGLSEYVNEKLYASEGAI